MSEHNVKVLEVPFALRERVIIDGDDSLVGVVLGYTWRGGDVSVEVSWIHNGIVNVQWLAAWRLSIVAGKRGEHF